MHALPLPQQQVSLCMPDAAAGSDCTESAIGPYCCAGQCSAQPCAAGRCPADYPIFKYHYKCSTNCYTCGMGPDDFRLKNEDDDDDEDRRRARSLSSKPAGGNLFPIAPAKGAFGKCNTLMYMDKPAGNPGAAPSVKPSLTVFGGMDYLPNAHKDCKALSSLEHSDSCYLSNGGKKHEISHIAFYCCKEGPGGDCQNLYHVLSSSNDDGKIAGKESRKYTLRDDFFCGFSGSACTCPAGVADNLCK